MTRHVAVLMGGWSAERDVSLSSGKACADALERAGFRVTRIDVRKDPHALLAALEPHPDVIFNALHGRGGEDGTVQGLLEMLGIPYTHSGVAASALAMDKPLTKVVLAAHGLPVADGAVLPPDRLGKEEPIARPYVVKPAREGSSVGVYIVEEGTNGPDYSGWSYGDALVEEYIPGRELTVGVMDDHALGITELRPRTRFYDYEAKYTGGVTEHLCPAPVPAEIAKACMDHAVAAHRALGCRGVSRSDFRWDEATDRLVILEVNTQPGMTDLSLVPEQAVKSGMSFEQLVTWMVEQARCDS